VEYFGYMKRDPDEAGYAFWLAKLNQFGGNFVNAEMVLAFISITRGSSAIRSTLTKRAEGKG